MDSIILDQISHGYGSTHAVSNVSFRVGPGEVFGLIGPDGAGKSTLFEIMTTLRIPQKGKATVLGFDTVKDYRTLRKKIGYMPGRFSLYPDLSVKENLQFFATIFGTTVKENYHLVKDIYDQLAPFSKRRAADLSGGMKQKLALCCALIHQPEVLFLDEPTTGVDAVSRAEFWDMLGRLKEHNISIVVSTPYMDEASRCERVALIQEGHILSIDTPKAVAESYTKPLYAVRARDFYRLLQELRKADFVERVETFGEFLHLTTFKPLTTEAITKHIEGQGFEEVQVLETPATIEDVFLDLMEAPAPLSVGPGAYAKTQKA